MDGTCVQTTQDIKQQIRMLGYEIEECDNTTSRLNMHFVLDTEQFQIGNDTRYRVVRSAEDIVPDPLYSALGFGTDVVNFAHNDFGNNVARSSFTIKTACQRFDETNCAYLFNNRDFRFSARVLDCTTISGPLAEGCLDPMHFIYASIHVSISSCTRFPQHVDVSGVPRGNGVVHYRGIDYRGSTVGYSYDNTSFEVCNDDTRGVVGIETSAYNTSMVMSVITDMRVCRVEMTHYLEHCVYGNSSECYNRGCYNWDPQDSPIQWHVDIIKDREVTAIALSNAFLADGCYINSEYNENHMTMCEWDRCNKLNMDDSFEFNFKPLYDVLPDTAENSLDEFYGQTFVFDIKYDVFLCGSSRRRLLSDDIQYSMAAFKMKKADCQEDSSG